MAHGHVLGVAVHLRAKSTTHVGPVKRPGGETNG